MIPAPPPPYAWRPLAAADTECSKDYWLFMMMDSADREAIDYVESFPGQPLDRDKLMRLLVSRTLLTYNGIRYDMPMIMAAACGCDNYTLKQINDSIIQGGAQYWEIYRQLGISDPTQDDKYNDRAKWVDHIDLMSVSPAVHITLKMHGARMHSRRLQDLPFDPHASIAENDRAGTRFYCANDLHTTLDLHDKMTSRLDLRHVIGQRHGLDLRSKSDAQMTEAIIKHKIPVRVETVAGGQGVEYQIEHKVAPPFWKHGTVFRYNVPDFVQFSTPVLQEVLQRVSLAEFTFTDKDQVEDELDEFGNKVKTCVVFPKSLKMPIRIGQSVYKMGIGGLHSQEKSVYHLAIDGVCSLKDSDVTSFYPSIILNAGMFPPALGPGFTGYYQGLFDERILAKRRAQELSLKLTELRKELEAIDGNATPDR